MKTSKHMKKVYLLIDMNKNSTENHAHGYSETKKLWEALLTDHISIFIVCPHTIHFCGLMWSVKFLQHHAEFHMGLYTKIDALSAVAQMASRYLTNCCSVNAYQISAGNPTSL